MFESSKIVSYQGVSIKQRDGFSVLNDVSFSIEKGEFVFIIGKTGSGKSSLLKTLYADLPIHIGNAEVAGFSLNPLKNSIIPTLRRKIGIIFQDFQLLYDRSVAENLLFVLKATGWSSKQLMKARVNEVLLQVGLPNAAPKLPHQLSGGEQQRVVIARALLNEPILLIADEPTGNLDPEVSRDIMKIFKAINNSGTAVFMATHNHELIKDFPARVMQCANGSFLTIDNSAKLY